MAKRNAIGLDIGTSGIRGAELSFGRQGVTLEKIGQVAIPEGAVREGMVLDPDVVTGAIKELWSRTRFSHRNVVLGVANPRVIARQMDLPKLPPADLRKALPYQVQEFLPMPVEDAVLDFHVVEHVQVNGQDMVRGMLVAANRDLVLGQVAAAEAAGLKPVAVDLSTFAVLRSVGDHSVANAGVEAIVDIGSVVTNVVVHRAGVPRFVRILTTGGQAITDHASERMGLPQAEAEELKQRVGLMPTQASETVAARVFEGAVNVFAEELRGSLDYYNSTNPTAKVERVLLSGGGSVLRGLPARLSQVLSAPIVVANPLGRLRLGKTGLDQQQLDLVSPLAAVPVGLALGAE